MEIHFVQIYRPNMAKEEDNMSEVLVVTSKLKKQLKQKDATLHQTLLKQSVRKLTQWLKTLLKELKLTEENC